MAKNLFVTLWPVNTVEGTASLSLDQKLTKLRKAVADAESLLLTSAARVGVTDPLMIFAAPEYYFVKNVRRVGNSTAWDLYDKDEKDHIYAELKRISKDHKKVLIFPGTVYWKKRRAQPTGRNNARIWDGLNMAPVLYKGSVEFDYQKKFDDGSCGTGTDDVVFQPGTGGQTFKLWNMLIGVEVCGDFEESRLASAATAQLDLEVYISATNPHAFTDAFMGRIPVKNGGYFIHCDATGEAVKNGVWLINRHQGWHGISANIDKRDAVIYDPFTCKAIPVGHSLGGDYSVYGATGQTVSLSKVFRVTLDKMYYNVRLPILPAPPPPLPAPMGGGYSLRVVAVEPLRMTDSGFQAKITAQLRGTDVGGPQQRVSAAAIQFGTSNGTVSPAYGTTNIQGMATSTVTATGNGPVTVSAKWQGVQSTAVIELQQLGAGNVSRMGKLLANPHAELPSWHVLL